LKMVGNEGVSEGKDVEEAEGGKKRDAVEKHGDQRAATEALLQGEENHDYAGGGGEREPTQRLRWIRQDALIIEREVGGIK